MVLTRGQTSSTPHAGVNSIHCVSVLGGKESTDAKSAGHYRYLLERFVVPVSSRVHSEDWVVDAAQIVR